MIINECVWHMPYDTKSIHDNMYFEFTTAPLASRQYEVMISSSSSSTDNEYSDPYFFLVPAKSLLIVRTLYPLTAQPSQSVRSSFRELKIPQDESGRQAKTKRVGGLHWVRR